MAYLEEALAKINGKYRKLEFSHDELLLKLMSFQQRLKNEKAKEYLMQGVGRRLKILARCIKNIFTIFPAERTEHLSKEELADIDINLHAFFINISGVFDNLGWIYVYENDLLGKTNEGKIPRNGVGLFCDNTQDYLSRELNNYLNSEVIKAWYTDYPKNYRDSLAHRIPLYVPPSLLNKKETKELHSIEDQLQKLDFSKECDKNRYDELLDAQQNLGTASHFFSHSLSEGCRPIYFHAQVLADFATVEEGIEKFINHF